jgi:hypothetical protein
MNDNELNNSEGLSDTDKGQTPGETGSDVSEVKDILNETLGKDFPNDETALKAVKDTFNFVGKTGQFQEVLDTVKQEQGLKTEEEAINYLKGLSSNKGGGEDKGDFVSRKELAERDFFNENSEYKPYKEVIKAIAKDKGMSIQDAVNSDEVKPFIEKVLAHDKSENAKSVLHSNPRIASAKDKMAKARETITPSGDGLPSAKELDKAGELAVDAVIDAFPAGE